jgi:hypothetical protein
MDFGTGGTYRRHLSFSVSNRALPVKKSIMGVVLLQYKTDDQAQGSLIPAVISHQLIGKAVQCPKNIPTYHLHQLHASVPSFVGAHLHHPPINHIVGLQLPVKNCNLKDGHPPKQANLKECQ